jgi:ubiquinone/menaquinone biosynthesis C-methylase UbiE
MIMSKIRPFEKYTSRYEDWFERNKYVYRSELQAIHRQLPEQGEGVEIGVGTGRFAAPLGIKHGVEPSTKMREIAKQRGIDVLDGTAEKLPFDDSRFDFLLMVTTICFLDDILGSLKEAYRVIKPGGFIIIGFVDRTSPVGKQYLRYKNESVFYKIATFYSSDEVASFLEKAGFTDLYFSQTIFRGLADIRALEPVKEGCGEGSFVVIKAKKEL